MSPLCARRSFILGSLPSRSQRGVHVSITDIQEHLPEASHRRSAHEEPATKLTPMAGRARPPVRMVGATAHIDGRRWRYAISDNEPAGRGAHQIWAVNIHGYFAAGGMYWRESARLARRLGWRVLNPSLPGFGGSDPLSWSELSMSALSDGIGELLDHVGAQSAVILGHSMGGAVAVQFAADHPDRTLGSVYRDGAATSAWKRRRGFVVRSLAPFIPDFAALVDILGATALDFPDIVVGRLTSTLRSIIPDARRNVRSLGRALPVGAMLIATDLTDKVAHLAAAPDHIPVLPVWGCFDRITHARTADEFERISGEHVIWVPGGHSWMLARPETQPDVLIHHPRGQQFVRQVALRAAHLRRARRARPDRR